MKNPIFLFLLMFLLFVNNNSLLCKDSSAHEQAMKKLKEFLYNKDLRKAYAAEHPEAAKAENMMLKFPPHIQKRLINVILMIMQESGEGTEKHVTAIKKGGPEAAFNSFSQAVQNEIRSIAAELEKDSQFMKSISGKGFK